MRKSKPQDKLLRKDIYDNLYLLQQGMSQYRNSHDRNILKKTFHLCFESIIRSAQRAGAAEIVTFCKDTLEICELAGWSDKDFCLEVFCLINKSMDWMLVVADPELERYYSREKGPLTSCAPYKMLTDIKKRLSVSTSSLDAQAMNPAVCYAA